MSLRKLVVLLVAVCLLAAVVAVIVINLTFGGEASPYAYMTSQELVVMREDRVVTRVPRIFDEADPSKNKVAWSNDGKYLALFSDSKILQEDPGQIELIVVNSRTGELKRSPCPRCQDFVPIESSSLLVKIYESGTGKEAKHRYEKRSLESPEIVVPTNFPAVADGGFAVAFLAGASNYVLTRQGVSRSRAAYGQELVLVHLADGKILSSNYLASNDYMIAVAHEDRSGEYAQFAVASNRDSGLCRGSFPIALINFDGSLSETDLSGAEPPGFEAKAGGFKVSDLAWGVDGILRATITSWTCDESKASQADKKVLFKPPASWKLDGKKWVKDGDEPSTMVRQLASGDKVVLVIPNCIGPEEWPDRQVYCNTGELYREVGGRRTVLAQRVISVSTPPRS